MGLPSFLSGPLLVLFLSAACAKVPPKLIVPQLSLTDPASQNSLAAFTGAPIIGDNKVEILLNGEETFPAMVRAIRSAQKTITFEAYIFRKSSVGVQLVDALAERCRTGVRVAVLLDAHGSMDVPTEYVDTLKQAGCDIVPDFRPLRPWKLSTFNLRTHRRIVVIDGQVGFTGGYGIDDMWTGNGRTKGKWRETNVRVKGPIVQQLQAAFVEHWREATGVLLGGREYFPYPPIAVADLPTRAQVVWSSPYRDNFGMYALFLQAISSANHSILISTPYLLPGDQLTDALIEAVHRGVSVVVLVPGVTRDAGIEYVVHESQRDGFGTLLDGGIQLYEYDPALLHTKSMTIDGRWATVGSTNLDNRSMGINDELNLVVYDEGVTKRLEQVFVEDLSRSSKITREQLEDRGWLRRLLGFLTSPMKDHF